MIRQAKAALALSLVLNMLFAGMVLGDVSRRFFSPLTIDVDSHLAKLPADKRALFEKIMGPAEARMNAERRQIDEMKREELRILKADSFDAAAYMTQFDHISDMNQKMKRQVAEAVVELAKQLTPEERTVVAEVISHPPFTLAPGALRELSSPVSGRQISH